MMNLDTMTMIMMMLLVTIIIDIIIIIILIVISTVTFVFIINVVAAVFERMQCLDHFQCEANNEAEMELYTQVMNQVGTLKVQLENNGYYINLHVRLLMTELA